jgi:hypothetical protein
MMTITSMKARFRSPNARCGFAPVRDTDQ